jgi:hypothetical protein
MTLKTLGQTTHFIAQIDDTVGGLGTEPYLGLMK